MSRLHSATPGSTLSHICAQRAGPRHARPAGANFDTLCEHYSHVVLFSVEPTEGGGITGLDRLMAPKLLHEAQQAAARHGNCRLLLCFGGNGRSAGFSAMTRSAAARKKFIHNMAGLVEELQFDGVGARAPPPPNFCVSSAWRPRPALARAWRHMRVCTAGGGGASHACLAPEADGRADINWEYPGYAFGSGYAAEAEVLKDYEGLAALLADMRAALGPRACITAAYYPDGRQEALLLRTQARRRGGAAAGPLSPTLSGRAPLSNPVRPVPSLQPCPSCPHPAFGQRHCGSGSGIAAAVAALQQRHCMRAGADASGYE